MSQIRVRGILILAFAFFCSQLYGQSTNGSIGGTIEDVTHALLPGVRVTATNVATGVASTLLSNETGAYNFSNLLPGQYKVTVELPSFQTESKVNVEVGNGQQLRLNFVMKIAATQQSVEVTVAADSLLAVSSASVAGVLNEQRVRDLPIVGNNAMDLFATQPGFVAGFNGTAGQPRSEASYETSISGLNVAGNVNVTRDGINNSAAANSNLAGYQAATVLNPDMIGELRVVVAPVDAELGRGNAQMQVLTRSGTNVYRGSAVWNVQNSALNSKTWQENTTGLPPSAQPGWFNTHQYTLSYGGPIKRNKTFFFVLWDQALDWQRSNVVSTVLSPCARNGIFRFFDNVINGNAAIPNSSTQARSVDSAGNPVSNLGPLRYASVFGPLPANLPAANADCSNIAALANRGSPWDSNRTDFDTTGYVKRIVSSDFMPLPNRWDVGDGLNTAGVTWVRNVRGNGDLGGVSFQGTDQLNRRQINGKIDHNFSVRHKLAFGYTYEYTYSEGQNVQLGLPAYPNSAPASKAYRRPHVFTTNLTSTLTSNMVNEARVGLRRTANESGPQTSESLKDLFFNVNGYSVLPRLGSGTAFSGTSAVPFQNAAFNYFTPSRNVAPFWTFSDTLSWAKGKHALRFGGETRRNSLTIWDNGEGSNATPMALGRTETDTLFAQVSGIAGNTPYVSGISSVLAGTTATGNVLAMRQLLSFLAGSVGNVTQNFYLNTSRDLKWSDVKSSPYRNRTTQQNEYSFFAKDDWKIRRNLTINVGVRWDYYGIPWEANGMTAGLVGGGSAAFGYSGRSFDDWMTPGKRGDLTSFEFIGPNSPNPGRTLFPKDWNNAGPAVGFSWQLPWFGEGKTAVRGGYQVTYQTRTTLGAAAVPEPATTSWSGTLSDNTGRPAYLDLARLQASLSSLIPVSIPVSPDRPLQPVPLTRSQALTVFDPNLVTPYVQNLTLSLTRSLSSFVTLDLRYVGTLARKQFFGSTYNLNIPNFRSNGLKDAFDIVRAGGESALLNNIFRGQTVGGQAFDGTNAGARMRTSTTFANNLANGNYVGLANSLNTLSTSACNANSSVIGQAGSVLRCNGFPENFVVANPQFSTITYNTNLASNNYHSMQAQVTVRPYHGVGFQATYTWSKNLGIQNCCTGPSNGGQSGNFVGLTDPLDRRRDYTLTGDDRTHILQTNGSFELPLGPGKQFLKNSSGILARAAEGWKLGWIFNLVSGPAMDIQAANMLYGNGVPDIVGPFPFEKAGVRWGQDAGTYKGGNYFPTDELRIAKDPQCANTSIVASSLAANCNLGAVYDAKTGQPLLVHPLPGQRGTLGRRVVRGVAVPTFDMNLAKSFHIRESKTVQLRVDASNVLNHPTANTPQLSLAPSAATNALNTSFGQILNATGFSTIGAKTGYRKVQMGLRFSF